jgi:hypothetical protein
MTNALRATTVSKNGAVSPKHSASRVVPSAPCFPSKGPTNPSVRSSNCQEAAKYENGARLRGGRKTQALPNGRMTFKETLADVRSANICRLKNHAFAANQVAKVAIGKSRRICYRRKSETINALVRLRAASLCTVELSLEEPLIGVQFVGGGKLHTLPSNLDSEAREILAEQLIAAINHGKTGTIGARAA